MKKVRVVARAIGWETEYLVEAHDYMTTPGWLLFVNEDETIKIGYSAASVVCFEQVVEDPNR